MIRRVLQMFVLAFAVVAIFSLPGCGGSIAGTYELDKEAIKEAMTTEAEDDPMAALALGMIDAMSMTLTLDADGTATASTTAMGDAQNASGTWTQSGDTISVTMTDENGVTNTLSGTVAGDTLEFTDPSGDQAMNLIFKKS